MDRFVLSIEEMEFLGYFVSEEGHHRGTDTKDETSIFAIDCEMVITTLGNEVAVIALNDKKIFVKPEGEIIDYVTAVTGVSEDTKFDMTMSQLIDHLSSMVSPHDILVGHHMYQDLRAINFFHPRVIDTALIFHHPDGPPYYYSLKQLALSHLRKSIQDGVHDPVEDAMTARQLVEHCVANGFVKASWKHIGHSFVPTMDVIADAVDVDEITAVFIRGSRAVGTAKVDSDYDIVLICKNSRMVNGSLVRYGNLDIVVYGEEHFMAMLRGQIVWALECIYAPDGCVIFEKVDYRAVTEEHRAKHTEACNEALRRSVGYESSRKVSSSKKHFANGNLHASRKHYFIAARFAEYGRQMATYGKIVNIRQVNWFWERLLQTDDPSTLRNEYIEIYRQFSRAAPKKAKVDRDVDVVGDSSSGDVDIAQLLKYINDHGVEALEQEYQISVRPSKEDGLKLLIHSPKTPDCMFKRLCRSLILDDDNRMVAYPFNNFVNTVDDSNIKYITEKVDGSFAMLYCHRGQWKVSTKRNPDGDTVVGVRMEHEVVFRDLFWKIFNERGYDLSAFDSNVTYMFELVSPDHPIIIFYERSDLVLIGARRLDTFEEIDIYSDEFSTLSRPKRYDSYDVGQLDPNLVEGFVVIHNDFSRAKVKTHDYVKRSWMFPLCAVKDAHSIHLRIATVIQQRAVNDFVKYCPEYRGLMTEALDRLSRLKTEVENCLSIAMTVDRKSVSTALKCKPKNLLKYVYPMLDGKSFEDFVAEMNVKKLLEDLGM